MRILHLHVKKKYFDQIKSGAKKHEYRRITTYWTKRLVYAPDYNMIMLYCGYPRKGDSKRTLIFPYTGWYIITNFVHPQFGDQPVDVYAIHLQGVV